MGNLAAVSGDGQAHIAFLETSAEMTRAYAEALHLHNRLSNAGRAAGDGCRTSKPQFPAFSRDQCLDSARGSAAAVWGCSPRWTRRAGGFRMSR
jgi:hypothetical protein